MGGHALLAHSWFLEPTPSAPQRWEHCRWWLTKITDRVSRSSLFIGLALLLVSLHLTRCLRTLRAGLLRSHSVAARAKGSGQSKVSQPVAAYHLTHSITSAVGSLQPEVNHLILYFHSGQREVPEWAPAL